MLRSVIKSRGFHDTELSLGRTHKRYPGQARINFWLGLLFRQDTNISMVKSVLSSNLCTSNSCPGQGAKQKKGSWSGNFDRLYSKGMCALLHVSSSSPCARLMKSTKRKAIIVLSNTNGRYIMPFGKLSYLLFKGRQIWANIFDAQMPSFDPSISLSKYSQLIWRSSEYLAPWFYDIP